MSEQGNPEETDATLHCKVCALETRHVVRGDQWVCAAPLHKQREAERRRRLNGASEAAPAPDPGEATEDVVRQPSHYVRDGIEVRHVIRAFRCNYNVGVAVAYLLRAPFKGTYELDVRKAREHLGFEIEGFGHAE